MDQATLDALYRGAVDDAALQVGLQRLSEGFGCRSAALVSLDTTSPATNVIVNVGIFDADAVRRYAAYADLDPAPAHFARLAMGTASTTDRMLPAEASQGIFAQEFYLPLGLTETLGGHIYSDRARFQLIGLHRGPDRRQFDDDDIAEVKSLIPHLRRVLQLRRAFHRVESRATGLEGLLDRVEYGAVLLNGGEEAAFVNASMRLIGNDRDGLTLDRSGRPVASAADQRIRLAALINSVEKGGAGGVMRVPRPSGRIAYAVLVSPVPMESERRRGPGGVLLLVHDPARAPPTDPQLLQQGLGLPPGAARLAAALATDADLKTFAEREGITIHTARFHLRTALSRTETRTQSELVRLAARLLRDFSVHRPRDR